VNSNSDLKNLAHFFGACIVCAIAPLQTRGAFAYRRNRIVAGYPESIDVTVTRGHTLPVHVDSLAGLVRQIDQKQTRQKELQRKFEKFSSYLTFAYCWKKNLLLFLEIIVPRLLCAFTPVRLQVPWCALDSFQ